jgi:glycosyltransferase involved in cell wall biosynthesis
MPEPDRAEHDAARRPATIAQLIETDGPGGAEVVVFELSQELRRRGHRVVVVGPEQGEGWLSGKFLAAGFERLAFRVRRALDPQFLVELTRMLRDARVDVVHSHEFTCAVYGAAAARWLGLPHVITMHGNERVARVLRRRLALRWAFGSSHAAVAVSETTQRDMALRLGVPVSGLTVVPNGVPERKGDPARVRTELSLAPGELLLLAVGNCYERKGHRVLLSALQRLCCDGKERRLHLAIAGRGREEARLAALAQDWGIAERFHLLGTRTDVPDLLAAADVYVMPSHWEGMPLALLEAMLAGKPCIASNVGGIPEVIPSEEFGLLVPAGDPSALAGAIARLADEPGLREQLGRAARERALSRFTLSAS